MNTITAIRLQPQIPAELLSKLQGRSGKYTDFKTIFYALELDGGIWVGVIGDGDNGMYERFRYSVGTLTVSSAGYGDPCIALRDAINAFCYDSNA